MKNHTIVPPSLKKSPNRVHNKIRLDAARNRNTQDAAETGWPALERRRQRIHDRLMRPTPGTIGAVEAAEAYRLAVTGATQ